ncbi:hypothetical protein PAPHI01_2009 [Pancytospora philotis]|nr:hypothetical protein PAPHI01_2009 [Pancytospora philotis]
MDIVRELIALLTLCLALFNLNGIAVAQAGQGDSLSFLTRNTREQPPVLSPKALEQAEAAEQEMFDEALYTCYYRDQPVLPKSKRAKEHQSIMHKLCSGRAFKHDIIPKKERSPLRGERPHHADEEREARDKKTEAAPFKIISLDYSEARDGLYTILTKFKGKPACTYAEADSAAAETPCPTFSSAELVSMTTDFADIISVAYDKMQNYMPANPHSVEPDRMLSYFGHYYLKSKGFERFLEGWEKNSKNARYYIWQGDVDRIRDEIDAIRPFHELSDYNKQLFAKLFFVRNMLEVYSTIRLVMRPLGLVADEHRTAEDFLQAMYEYLVAVHKSDGELAVEYAVTSGLLRAELFNFGYADCYPPNITGMSAQDEAELKLYLDGERYSYIEGMVILFQAWSKSARAHLDPAVLSDVTNRFYSFIKPSDDYNDGCKELARD